MCRSEEKVAGADLARPVFHPVTAGSRGDDVEFISLMRNLRSIRGSSGEPDFEVTVDEHLDRSPRCPRESEGGG